MVELTFRIYGLVCECTIDLLCARLSELDGVGALRIDVRTKELRVCLDQEQCSLACLLGVIGSVGLQTDHAVSHTSDSRSDLPDNGGNAGSSYDALYMTT